MKTNIQKPPAASKDRADITRTTELATVVRRAIGQKPGDPRDAATRTFQGLRIHVNRELDELAAEGAGRGRRAARRGGLGSRHAPSEG